MATVQHLRGTKASFLALAGAGGLLPGQLYLLTDEERVAIALTTSTYQTFAKESEGASGSAPSTVTLDFGASLVEAKVFTFTHVGALTGQKVVMSTSANMPAGMDVDELEMDGFTCAAYVSSNGNITAVITAVPGPVTGQRNFNYMIG